MIEMRRNEDSSRTHIAVVCDACGKVIERASDGNYEWGMSSDGFVPTTPLYFAHKRCSQNLERQKCSAGDEWGTSELSYFPLRLGFGLNLDWRESMKMLESISLFD